MPYPDPSADTLAPEDFACDCGALPTQAAPTAPVLFPDCTCEEIDLTVDTSGDAAWLASMQGPVAEPQTLARPAARDHAAAHIGVDPSRVEVMTAHRTYTEATVERAEYARRFPVDGVDLRVAPTPAGERLAWMVVAVLPEQAEAPVFTHVVHLHAPSAPLAA